MLTSMTTLSHLDFFKSYFDRWNTNNEPLQIFLDIDPDIFIHILNKLRHSKYVLPNDENIDILCDYLGIEMVKNVVIPEPLSIKRAVVEEHYLTTWSTSLDISCKNRIIEVILTDNIDTVTRIDILFNPQTPKVSEYIYRIFHSTMEVFFDGPFENKKRLKTYKLKEYYLYNLNNISLMDSSSKLTFVLQVASTANCDRNNDAVVKFVLENTIKI